jgi:hypothetical protein
MLEALDILLIGLCFVSFIYFGKENYMLNMNLFRVFKKDGQSKNSVLSQWSNELDYPEDEYLTQAELQQLTRVISEVIRVEEFNRDYQISEANYTEAAKISKRINKLAKLQYKLKHKLKTRG